VLLLHSFGDGEHDLRAVQGGARTGLTVSVDWLENAGIDRELVIPPTAALLRGECDDAGDSCKRCQPIRGCCRESRLLSGSRERLVTLLPITPNARYTWA